MKQEIYHDQTRIHLVPIMNFNFTYKIKYLIYKIDDDYK
jgi:hypothetical protein